ncbi:pyridoxal phosphate-dependent transferase [Chytriomyces sp. MP71]|nr:pyridoxal phosphate-dependent transferase [Chytriomyces sp. MP71]
MRALFALDPSYVATNHGSFGAPPKAVIEAKLRKSLEIEFNPDVFVKVNQDQWLDESLLPAATLLGLKTVKDCVFSVNATTAINAVLRSLKALKILCFSSVYGNVKNGINYICDNDGFGRVTLDIPVPISDEDFVRRVRNVIDSQRALGNEIVLAIYDIISSVPGVICPYQQLTDLFRSHDILTCVDAAHAVGQIPVDLGQLKPDFFVTNLHKWLFVPRGCALFYVAPLFQKIVRHPVISEEKPGDWRRGFHWIGTIDHSAYLTTKAAIDFRKWIGGEEAIRDYCHRLAVRGGHIVADILGTSVMKGIGAGEPTFGDGYFAAMVNVRVPDTPIVREGGDSFIGGLQVKMLKQYNAAVAPYKYDGEYWMRLSAQVYLNDNDFHKLGNMLREVFFDGK